MKEGPRFLNQLGFNCHVIQGGAQKQVLMWSYTVTPISRVNVLTPFLPPFIFGIVVIYIIYMYIIIYIYFLFTNPIW